MKKIIYGIYGASGFGKEVLPLVRDFVLKSGKDSKNIFFIDDGNCDEYLNGYKILSFEEFFNMDADEYYVSIAISNSKIREALTQKCQDNGAKSVVTKSIPEGMKVFGNPAIEFTKENIKRRR